jgi:hypothetical protein
MEAASLNATWLTFMYVTYHSNFSVGLGWKERASSVLDGVEECAAHGWVTLLEAPFSRDPVEREQLAVSALSIARRFGDVDLEIEALTLRGEALVVRGQVREGCACSTRRWPPSPPGVRDHFALGEICCRMLSACETALDVRRATDWLSVVTATWSGRTSCDRHAGRTTAASSSPSAAGTKPRRSFSRDRRLRARLPWRPRNRSVAPGGPPHPAGPPGGGRAPARRDEWHPTARRMAATIALARHDTELAAELGSSAQKETSSPIRLASPRSSF